MSHLGFIAVLLFLLTAQANAATTVSFQDGQNAYNGTEDSYVHESFPGTNFGAATVVKADGADGSPPGEVATLIKWDVTPVPVGATVTTATVTLDFYNSSTGNYNLFAQNSSWAEGTVVWGGLDSGTQVMGSVIAGFAGVTDIALNASGIALVQSWVANSANNFGIAIRTAGSSDGIAARSSESTAFHPKLTLTYSEGEPTIADLLAKINLLQNQIDSLKNLFSGTVRDGNTIRFEGVNLQVVNGLGATNGDPGSDPFGDLGSDSINASNGQVNGLGNLIVGYDEATPFSDKTGSHNIVVGPLHSYTRFGGLVVGIKNSILGNYSSVSGGEINTANGQSSSVSGGTENDAHVWASSVSGGGGNRAEGFSSSVSGGTSNHAIGGGSSISGGTSNQTSAVLSSISGGAANRTNGAWYSSILGGRVNEASGEASTVLGGNGNMATTTDSIAP